MSMILNGRNTHSTSRCPKASSIASILPIVRLGATPVLVDCDRFGQLDVDLAAAAVTPRTKAIVGVDLFGHPCDADAIRALCERSGLRFVEDAAQAFGASWNGVRAGGLGDAAAFSFYPTKNLSAMGDAGMVTTRSAETDERVRRLRTHGMRQRYFHDEIGWNARMDTIQAAVL